MKRTDSVSPNTWSASRYRASASSDRSPSDSVIAGLRIRPERGDDAAGATVLLEQTPRDVHHNACALVLDMLDLASVQLSVPNQPPRNAVDRIATPPRGLLVAATIAEAAAYERSALVVVPVHIRFHEDGSATFPQFAEHVLHQQVHG